MKGIHLGIGSYYGDVHAYEINGKYYTALGSWSGTDYKEISKDLFDAFVKEYGEPVDLNEEYMIDEEGYSYRPENHEEMYDEVRWIIKHMEKSKEEGRS